MGTRFRHTTTVRFRDLDSMGHVNHAVYLTYWEEARIGYFRHVFGSLDNALGSGLGVPGRAREPFEFVVARAEVDFRRPAGLRDVLTTSCGVVRFGTTSFDFAYETVDGEGREVARGRTVQVSLGADGRPRSVPAAFRRGIEDYEAGKEVG